MLSEFSLAGKTALVTGAGRGIGTGIAQVFAEAGARVAVNALTGAYANPFVETLNKSFPGNVAILGDCTTAAGAAEIVRRAQVELGEIDILVNNLGDAVPSPFARLRDESVEVVSDESIDKVIDLNLMGTIYCTRAAAPTMLQRRRGKIINISSIGGVRGSPGLSLYSAGKHALMGLTRSWALEWAKYGIQVNSIAPGLFPDAGKMTEEQFAAAKQRVAARVPAGRAGEFRDVGLMALFLASAASDYVTGQTISVDGGMSA